MSDDRRVNEKLHGVRHERRSMSARADETKEAAISAASRAFICHRGVGSNPRKRQSAWCEPQTKTGELKTPELVHSNFRRVKPFASPVDRHN
jgi:hypothetical protein